MLERSCRKDGLASGTTHDIPTKSGVTPGHLRPFSTTVTAPPLAFRSLKVALLWTRFLRLYPDNLCAQSAVDVTAGNRTRSDLNIQC